MQRRVDKTTLEKTLNQKHCSKELLKVFESFLHSTNDFIHYCHLYLTKRLELNFEKEYYEIKSEWLQLNESLIVISTPGSDPFL